MIALLRIPARHWAMLGAGLLVVIAVTGAIRHYGAERFKAGEAAREAFWRPKFETAQVPLTQANARAKALEEASVAISEAAEIRHAKTMETLNVRAADAHRRINGLVRELAERSRCEPVPEDADLAKHAAQLDEDR